MPNIWNNYTDTLEFKYYESVYQIVGVGFLTAIMGGHGQAMGQC